MCAAVKTFPLEIATAQEIKPMRWGCVEEIALLMQTKTASAMHLKDALMQARTTSPLTPKTTMAHANLIWWRSPAWVIWISVGTLI